MVSLANDALKNKNKHGGHPLPLIFAVEPMWNPSTTLNLRSGPPSPSLPPWAVIKPFSVVTAAGGSVSFRGVGHQFGESLPGIRFDPDFGWAALHFTLPFPESTTHTERYVGNMK